jgi:hypothetical protein
VTLSTALALTLLIGLPLMLLSLGVLAHAYVLATRAAAAPALDPTDRALRSMATASMDDLILELQRSIEDLKGQMAGQRRSLEGLLARPVPAAATAAVGSAPAAVTAAAGNVPPARVPSQLDLDINELIAEGLSDRAIARRLRVGLEEVRMARTLRGRP